MTLKNFTIKKSQAACFLALALAIIFLHSWIGPSAAQPQTGTRVVAPIIEDSSLVPLASFTITINVTGVGPLPEDMDAWEINLQLDPAVLRIDDVRDGPVLNNLGGQALRTIIPDPVLGTVFANEFIILGTPQPQNLGFVGSGILLYVDVTVLASGNSTLDLHDTALRDLDGTQIIVIPHSSSDGFFANSPANLPPVAEFTFTPSNPLEDSPVIFDASLSHDQDLGGSISLYTWDFGDGNITALPSPQATISHTYANPGVFNVNLTVTDNGGFLVSAKRNGSIVKPVVVTAANKPPIPSFTFTPTSPKVGEDVTFDASASTDPDGDSSQLDLLWAFGDGGTGGGVTKTHKYLEEGVYNVTLTARDRQEDTARLTRQITVGAGEILQTPPSQFPVWGYALIGVAVAGAAVFVLRGVAKGRSAEREAREEEEGVV